jgi:NhaA family Na+:H+ antiporter
MPIKTIKKFIRYEASSGILLFLAALTGLVVDNTGWSRYYQEILTTHLPVSLGIFKLDKPILMWVNDGFMSVFFLLVGLEVKRELTTGELSSPQDAMLPGIAAIGGMLIPALIYLSVTHRSAHLMQGWAIPTATDIAFSLGVLTLLAKRIPSSLKLFLTALAIFDDIGAILIIAIFYTSSLSLTLLILAVFVCAILFLLNLLSVQKNSLYVIFGFLLWLCVLKSGVHATLAGIILAFAIPMKKRNGQPSKMLETWEQAIHPFVAYFVLPIFAFFNAGIRFSEMSLNSLWSGVTLACILGLFLGKQIGIVSFSCLAVKCRWVKLPESMTMKGVIGVGLVAGIGFTMSLFIGSLAFSDAGVDIMLKVRLGVIVGSVISGVCGYFYLKTIYKK